MNKSELVEIAKELDCRLPNFFGIVYEKYKGAIEKWIAEQEEIDCGSDLVYQYIRHHIISIINKDFNGFMKTVSLEQLYWMHYILTRINMNSFQCDNKEENYAYYRDFNNQSFVNIVKRFNEFALPSSVNIYYKYPKPETTPYDTFDYSGEELDFSNNESVWGKEINDKIKEFFFDKITLHNIQNDISVKTEGLYKALLNKDFNPHFSEIWTEDYVELIGCVLDGKYKVNEQIISLDKIVHSDGDCSNDKEIIFANAISNESMFIHFNNWRHKKNDNAFKAFLKVIYKMISYITNINDEIDFTLLTNKEIIVKIASLINSNIEDCKGNSFKLDYLPGFNVYAYAAFRESFGQSHYWETARLICDHLKNTNESQLLDWFVN